MSRAHSQPSVSMGRESVAPKERRIPVYLGRPAATRCERCRAFMAPGDWPFCKGNPEDHRR